jgi:hypothetical protein
MKVRIIFRGLVLFGFEDTGLRAWLVSHGHARAHAQANDADVDPRHVHTPYIGVIGRSAADGREVVRTGIRIPAGETRFELDGHNSAGVLVTDGFDKYVPRLSELADRDPRAHVALEDYPSIVVPHGTIRARDFVTWDFDGNPAAKVGFMGTNVAGFMANEAVLDIGDEDGAGGDQLLVESATLEVPKALVPLVPLDPNATLQHEVDPDTVEILITNFSPQRRRSVFWSLHYQSLFQAAGFAKVDYTKTQQYLDFVRQVKLDPRDWAEWVSDEDAMHTDYPFPFIITDEITLPEGVREQAETPRSTVAPPRRGQGKRGKGQRDQGPHGVGSHVSSSASALNDPWSRPICPIGQL